MRETAPRQPPGLIGKILAGLLGAAFLVLAFMFSLVALAVVAVGGLLLWAWLWWKTRAIRQKMQQSQPRAEVQGEGLIIEGEVIRQDEVSDNQQSLPHRRTQ